MVATVILAELLAGWTSVNDGVMGGRSKGSARVDDGRLVFGGELVTDGGGFASVRAPAGKLGLAGAEGVRLRVRGDGRTYSFRLQVGEVSYRARFAAGPEWRDVWLPFREFVPTRRGRVLDRKPVHPARVESVGLLIADKKDGAFRLEVGAIEPYAAFDFDRFRWKARPMVVFAPRGDDARLERQLAALRETERKFRDRDMVLVVVTKAGARAGERPLDRAAAAALRLRFRIAAGDFAVRLVGKDGGIKESADEPVDPDLWYAAIDRMPMRQAEMAGH